MDDLAVITEEVHLLDAGDRLAAEALKVELELLIVATSRLVLHLVLPAGSALAADAHVLLELLKLVSVHPAL